MFDCDLGECIGGMENVEWDVTIIGERYFYCGAAGNVARFTGSEEYICSVTKSKKFVNQIVDDDAGVFLIIDQDSKSIKEVRGEGM